LATYDITTITAAQAMAFSAPSDTLSLGAANATQVSVAFTATMPEQVLITVGGTTTAFGAGVMGDQNLTFANGGRLFIGTDGADTANGGDASDALFGGQGDDRMDGGAGADVVQGNQGNDTLNGGAGSDTVYGGQGGDVIDLGSGAGAGDHNFANGNKGNDTITASNGVDTLLGGQGDDLLVGGSGGDVLDGNLGDDTIQGGPGDDTISGEGGVDMLTGGGGADLFDFTAGGSGTTSSSADVITDWMAADHIRLGVPVDFSGFMSVAATAGFSDYYGMHPGQTYTFDTGEMTAQMDMSSDPDLKVVAVQTTDGVVIYADTNGDHAIDLAIRLPGASLDALSFMSFV
jgi:Ca2+-binding RTX toxin-like protein